MKWRLREKIIYLDIFLLSEVPQRDCAWCQGVLQVDFRLRMTIHM
jgi:hypothetical protein